MFSENKEIVRTVIKERPFLLIFKRYDLVFITDDATEIPADRMLEYPVLTDWVEGFNYKGKRYWQPIKNPKFKKYV